MNKPVYTFPFGAPYNSSLYYLSKNADYIAVSSGEANSKKVGVYKSSYSSIPGEKAADNLLYPNPSSGVITIPLEDVPNYELKLIIHDMSGKEVYSGIAKIEGNNVIVDVAHYAKGSYLMMLQGNGFSRTYKFVKE